MPRGSAPGERRGGRKKGAPNKVKQVDREAIAASGLMPLDYMLGVIRNEAAAPDRRDRMATAAAPYCHPRLAPQVPVGVLEDRPNMVIDGELAETPLGRAIAAWREKSGLPPIPVDHEPAKET